MTFNFRFIQIFQKIARYPVYMVAESFICNVLFHLYNFLEISCEPKSSGSEVAVNDVTASENRSDATVPPLLIYYCSSTPAAVAGK